MDISALTFVDVPAAVELSRRAGWNQIPADWNRLIKLWPDDVFAGRIDGRLVATGTLATFDCAGEPGSAVSWIGMILVEEGYRGRRFGGCILDALLQRAREREVQSVALDATDAGRAVYLKRGF